MANTGNLVTIFVPDIDARMEDWTSIRLYSATEYRGSYSLLTTITLVADDTAYTYQHTTGTPVTWYRFSYYNTGTAAESSQGEPFLGGTTPAITLQTARRMVAERLELFGLPPGNASFPGVSGTTSGAGTSTTVVCSTYSDSSLPTRKYQGYYCLLNTGTYAGEERLVSTLASGTFTVGRAFTGAPGSAVTFDLYGKQPSTWWTNRVQDSLLDLWVPFELPIGGIDASQTEYSLPYWIENPDQVQRYLKRSGDTLLQHGFQPGQDYLLRRTNGGGVYAYLPSAIAQNSVWVFDGYRHPAMPVADSDYLIMSEQQQRLLVVTAAMRAAQRLAQAHGNPDNRRQWTERMQDLERERQGLQRETRQWRTNVPARRTEMIGITGDW